MIIYRKIGVFYLKIKWYINRRSHTPAQIQQVLTRKRELSLEFFDHIVFGPCNHSPVNHIKNNTIV